MSIDIGPPAHAEFEGLHHQITQSSHLVNLANSFNPLRQHNFCPCMCSLVLSRLDYCNSLLHLPPWSIPCNAYKTNLFFLTHPWLPEEIANGYRSIIASSSKPPSWGIKLSQHPIHTISTISLSYEILSNKPILTIKVKFECKSWHSFQYGLWLTYF